MKTCDYDWLAVFIQCCTLDRFKQVRRIQRNFKMANLMISSANTNTTNFIGPGLLTNYFCFSSLIFQKNLSIRVAFELALTRIDFPE